MQFPLLAYEPVLAVDWWNLFLDIVLPRTDRMVAIQWAIMGPLWLFFVGLSWGYDRDIRHFIQGVCLITFSWMLARMIH